MSADAAALADRVLNAALSAAGVSKAAGGVPVPLVRAALEGMAEQLMSQQAEARKALRAAVKMAKQQQAAIDRLAGEPDPDGPFKGTGLVVPFVPGQWRTELRPAFPPGRVNGHGHDS